MREHNQFDDSLRLSRGENGFAEGIIGKNFGWANSLGRIRQNEVLSWNNRIVDHKFRLPFDVN